MSGHFPVYNSACTVRVFFYAAFTTGVLHVRIIRHVPLGFFYCAAFYDGCFDDLFDHRPDFFCSKAGLFFYGMAGLSKQYRHAQ